MESEFNGSNLQQNQSPTRSTFSAALSRIWDRAMQPDRLQFLLPCIGTSIAVAGVSLWLAVLVINLPYPHAWALISDGGVFRLFMNSLGAIASCIGLLGITVEAFSSNRLAKLLAHSLVLAAGVAVFSQNGFAILAAVGVLAGIITNEHLSNRTSHREKEEDQP